MSKRSVFKKIKGTLLHKFKPLKYAKLVGVNFPWGGGYTSMGELSGVLSLG